MKLKIKTAPTVKPLTLNEAKAHLKITHNLEDDYVNSLIDVARDKFQADTQRVLTETVYELYLDNLTHDENFDCDIVIYKCPIISIDSIEVYTSETSDYSAVDASTYLKDIIGEPGRVVFNTYPEYYQRMNCIKVTFKAGYGTIPEQAKHALKLLIGHFYENRQLVEIGHITQDVPFTYQFLVDQFKYTL